MCEIYIILGNYSYYIGYIMNLFVLIVPLNFIVYCVKCMFIIEYERYNMIYLLTVPVFNYLIIFIYLSILFIVNICKPSRFPGNQR